MGKIPPEGGASTDNHRPWVKLSTKQPSSQRWFLMTEGGVPLNPRKGTGGVPELLTTVNINDSIHQYPTSCFCFCVGQKYSWKKWKERWHLELGVSYFLLTFGKISGRLWGFAGWVDDSQIIMSQKNYEGKTNSEKDWWSGFLIAPKTTSSEGLL